MKIGDKLEFDYIGEAQEVTLARGTYQLEVWGAEGGNRGNASGGKGGYSFGEIHLDTREVLTIQVGGMGDVEGIGYNGGGVGAYTNVYGGGATDVRMGGTDIENRIIVAGGGGSVGAPNKVGGAGGGLNGESRTESFGSGGGGGSQTAGGTGGNSNGGSLGQGGNGISRSNGYGGAGGGGYYGGGGVYPDGSGDDDRGGGGGSGYIGGVINGQTIVGNASMPSPSSSDTQIGQSGHGYCIITCLDLEFAGKCKINNEYREIEGMSVKIDNTWREVDSNYVKVDNEWKHSIE